MALSTEAASPIWTMAEPSFVLRNLTCHSNDHKEKRPLVQQQLELTLDTQKIYFKNIAVETEEIKQPVGVHLFHVETVDHKNGAFLRAIGSVDDPP